MLEVDKHDGVSVVTLHHGRVNALDLELLEALTGTIGALDTAVVLTGSGARARTRRLGRVAPDSAAGWARMPQ
jgi:enoyl-CoA hydratase/carnithine racemase